MEKHYFCTLCGDKDYDKSTHNKSARHIRAGANLAVRIVYQLRP